MKYVPGKSWPWPVLRPGNDDYERCEFQVDIDVDYLEQSTAVKVEADFVLSDRDLLNLISQDMAEYALLISCSTTHFRKTLTNSHNRLEYQIEHGQVVGNVEFFPYIVCTRPVQGFQGTNWHPDYAGRDFNLASGAVLALDEPSAVWIDSADEPSITSIFRISLSQEVDDGQWKCQLERDGRVHILLHHNQHERFNAARSRPIEETGAYILNSVYLPALVWLLNQADLMKEPEQEHELWWNALDSAIERAGLRPLGEEDEDRLRDAQTLFQLPFARLPLLKEL